MAGMGAAAPSLMAGMDMTAMAPSIFGGLSSSIAGPAAAALAPGSQGLMSAAMLSDSSQMLANSMMPQTPIQALEAGQQAAGPNLPGAMTSYATSPDDVTGVGGVPQFGGPQAPQAPSPVSGQAPMNAMNNPDWSAGFDTYDKGGFGSPGAALAPSYCVPGSGTRAHSLTAGEGNDDHEQLRTS